jgi:hypothetical protein
MTRRKPHVERWWTVLHGADKTVFLRPHDFAQRRKDVVKCIVGHCRVVRVEVRVVERKKGKR